MESRLSILKGKSNMQMMTGDEIALRGLGAMFVDKDRFGELVRQAREGRGIKAFELADLMHTHGSAISRLENGTFKETPAPDVLRQLRDLLGLDEREMLQALGYLQNENDAQLPEEEADPLRDQLTAVARKVRWREKPDLAHGLITVIGGILQDQKRAQKRRSAANSEPGR